MGKNTISNIRNIFNNLLGKKENTLNYNKFIYELCEIKQNIKVSEMEEIKPLEFGNQIKSFLKSKTVNDLKDICENILVKKTGKKDSIIDRILNKSLTKTKFN